MVLGVGFSHASAAGTRGAPWFSRQCCSSVKMDEWLAAGPCRALMASGIVPHLLMQGLQSSGKAALAVARSRVISSPEQIRVAEVHLHCPAWLLCRRPLPYHPACSSGAHGSPHCMTLARCWVLWRLTDRTAAHWQHALHSFLRGGVLPCDSTLQQRFSHQLTVQ